MSLPEILVILALALVILGPEKLPEVARTVGKAIREMRKAGNSLRDAIMLEDELQEFKNNTRGISDALATSPRDLMHETGADPAAHPQEAYWDHDPEEYAAAHADFDEDYHTGGSLTYDPHHGAWDQVSQTPIELSPQRLPLEDAIEVELAPADPPQLAQPYEEALHAHSLEDSPVPLARQVWLHDQSPHEVSF